MQADRGHDRRRSPRPPGQPTSPSSPFPAALQRAAVGYMFVAGAGEVAGAGRGRLAIRTRNRRRAAQTPRRTATQLVRAIDRSRRRGRGTGACDLRERPHPADRLPLEDRGERERQAARLLERDAGDGPQRDRGLGGRVGRRGLLRGLLLLDWTSIRASGDEELTAELIEPAVAHVELVELEGESRTTRMAPGPDARRPRLASPRAARRRRPDADRGYRSPEGRAGPALRPRFGDRSTIVTITLCASRLPPAVAAETIRRERRRVRPRATADCRPPTPVLEPLDASNRSSCELPGARVYRVYGFRTRAGTARRLGDGPARKPASRRSRRTGTSSTRCSPATGRQAIRRTSSWPPGWPRLGERKPALRARGRPGDVERKGRGGRAPRLGLVQQRRAVPVLG